MSNEKDVLEFLDEILNDKPKRRYWAGREWNNETDLPWHVRDQFEYFKKMDDYGKNYFKPKDVIKLIEFIYISESLKK